MMILLAFAALSVAGVVASILAVLRDGHRRVRTVASRVPARDQTPVAAPVRAARVGSPRALRASSAR